MNLIFENIIFLSSEIILVLTAVVLLMVGAFKKKNNAKIVVYFSFIVLILLSIVEMLVPWSSVTIFNNSIIHEEKLIEYSVKNSDITELSSEIKLQFLESYDMYKEDNIQSHSEDDLIKTGSVQVNYFTDSLTIKGFFLSEEDLEKVVTIKENNLLKVSLPNEVIYLKIREISKIDPLNIKQNIVNLIYSTIINEIKNNYEIEVNNQEILKL